MAKTLWCERHYENGDGAVPATVEVDGRLLCAACRDAEGYGMHEGRQLTAVAVQVAKAEPEKAGAADATPGENSKPVLSRGHVDRVKRHKVVTRKVAAGQCACGKQLYGPEARKSGQCLLCRDAHVRIGAVKVAAKTVRKPEADLGEHLAKRFQKPVKVNGKSFRVKLSSKEALRLSKEAEFVKNHIEVPHAKIGDYHFGAITLASYEAKYFQAPETRMLVENFEALPDDVALEIAIPQSAGSAIKLKRVRERWSRILRTHCRNCKKPYKALLTQHAREGSLVIRKVAA